MPTYDKEGIAARIRGLIGGQAGGDLSVIANRLGVSDVALRISVDDLAPHPTIDVIAAIVQVYGVDPSWLLSGEYDAATHRHMMESDATGVRQAMVAMVARATEPEPAPVPTLKLMRSAEG